MYISKPGLTFSIVICTDGRASTIDATLSSLFHLEGPSFEVCVVIGPTADGTLDAVLRLGNQFKVARSPVRNISVARNIGLSMSSGDVVAFIDDDAVPEKNWLQDLSKPYDDAKVGGVGGFVYDHTGIDFQARYVTTDRLGRANYRWERATGELNFPFAKSYPHLLGTNASFRRSALLEIGGFDEEYEYFLDETDVCCRLIDRGYKIIQLDRAFVHHKYSPGGVRDATGVVRNWYPLIKNRVYFGLKNGSLHHSFFECLCAGLEDLQTWRSNIERNCDASGCYNAHDLRRFEEEASAAICDGIVRGLRPGRHLLTVNSTRPPAQPFRPVSPLVPPEGRRAICFVSQDYPPGQNGGIGRYIFQLAHALGARGHDVHVVTKTIGNAQDSTEYRTHVWEHRVTPRHFDLPDVSPVAPYTIPSHVWNWSHSALHRVKQIAAHGAVDVVYAPIWDCEGIAFLFDGGFPLITSLQTTMRHWLASYGGKRDDEWMRIFGYPLIGLERLLMERSGGIHSISNAICRDVEALYDIRFGDRVHVAPLGLEDWRPATSDIAVQPRTEESAALRILFVGRLEKRKGIDVLLQAIPRVAQQFPSAVFDIVGNDTLLWDDGRTIRAAFESSKVPDDIKRKVRFHGHCEEDDLRQWYAGCDIFVAPSLYESFGLISLEAMMFSKPVIACRTGGIPEVVEDGVTGILVAPGDPASLAQALIELLRDETLRKQMGAAGRRRYETGFTDLMMAQELIPLLTEVAGLAELTDGDRAVSPQRAPLPVLEQVRPKHEFEVFGLDDPRLQFVGHWTRSEDAFIGEGVGASVTWMGQAQEVLLFVDKHSYSGEVSVISSHGARHVDLYSWAHHRSVVPLFRSDISTSSSARVTVTGKNPVSKAAQLVVRGTFVRWDDSKRAKIADPELVTLQTGQIDTWTRNVVKSGRTLEVVATERRRAYLRRWIELDPYLEPKSRLLDIGCGHFWPGLFDHLAARQIEYTGLAIDPRVIEQNISLSKSEGRDRFQFVCAVNDKLLFPSRHFDVVFSSHSIEHSCNLAATFGEVRRILRQGGIFFFAVPLNVDIAAEHMWIINSDQWIELTQAAGFRVRNTHIGDVYPEAEYDFVVIAERVE